MNPGQFFGITHSAVLNIMHVCAHVELYQILNFPKYYPFAVSKAISLTSCDGNRPLLHVVVLMNLKSYLTICISDHQ